MDILQYKFCQHLSVNTDICMGELCCAMEGMDRCVLCGGLRAHGPDGIGWKVELKINKLRRKVKGPIARYDYNVQQSSLVKKQTKKCPQDVVSPAKFRISKKVISLAGYFWTLPARNIKIPKNQFRARVILPAFPREI